MGRPAPRAGWDRPDLRLAHVNELVGDAATWCPPPRVRLVRGRWKRDTSATDGSRVVGGAAISVSRSPAPAGVPWREARVDVVLECTGPTAAEEVNETLGIAARGSLAGFLGYEQRPLVSADYRGDPRSAVIDVLSARWSCTGRR